MSVSTHVCVVSPATKQVAKFMASFATAKSQVTTMARRMQLGTSSPAGAEKLVKDLVASATRKVPEGKVGVGFSSLW